MKGPVDITWLQLCGAATLILLHAGLSAWLKLNLGRKLLVAGLRTFIQLFALGYILVPVFSISHPALVVGMCLLMVILAARESTRRLSGTYSGGRLDIFVALLISTGLTAWFATSTLLAISTWWAPRYLIPLAGMILGNSLTGITLGLDRCINEVSENTDRIESRLAFAATRWEAMKPVVVESLRAGMIPILNTMSVVGLVTIPGMMTGQILGGTEPALAARYQIMIMFLIAGATAVGATLSVLMASRRVIGTDGRVHLDRLSMRDA
jgi:putative ABC transport system permease protein